MLVSVTTITVEGEVDNSITMLLSCWVQILSSFCLLCRLNKNRSEKLSIILWPGENLEWRGVKEGKILLHLLTMLTKWPLIRKCWWLVRKLSEAECCKEDILWDKSMSNWMKWLGESECTCNCDFLPSFWRWSLMGISPAMASIPNKGEVLKAPRIHMVALLCIFPSVFKWYDMRVWL